MRKGKARRPSMFCLDGNFGRSPKTMKRHPSGRDWSSLPADILYLIAKAIPSLPDFINYSRVCTSWRSAAIEEKQSHGIKLPHMIFVTSHRKSKKPCYGFFSLSDHRIGTINLPHVPHGGLIGSSRGWVVTVEQKEMQVNLVNPLAGQVIPLVMSSCILSPGNPFVHQLSIPRKVVLSSSPAEGNCLAMAILSNGRDLAVARPGDEKWTLVCRKRFDRMYQDIVYHSGNFYAYESHGRLLVFDFSNEGAQPGVSVLWSYNMHLSYNVHSHHYLVSSEEKELFLVDRTLNKIDSRGCRFMVFRWEVVDEISQWVMIKTLDGRAFFLGNSSICLNEISKGCEKSCIYFTPDSDLFSPDDMGVHNLEDGSTRFYTGGGCSSITRPTWFVPRF